MWPSDTIWRHRPGSTLAQVMACWVMAPSNYLNQCRRHLSSVTSTDIHLRTISQEIPQPPITKIRLEITHLKFHLNLLEANELTHSGLSMTWIILGPGNGLSPVPGHYDDVIMGTIASQITSLTIVYSTVYSDTDQRKYQSSASLAFVRGIHRRPVNSPHKWPVTRKVFPFDDVIMPNHYLSLCWFIINPMLKNLSQWNIDQHMKLFIYI